MHVEHDPASEPETEDFLSVGDTLQLLLLLSSPGMADGSLPVIGLIRSSSISRPHAALTLELKAGPRSR